LDVARNLRGDLVLGNFQVVTCLEIHPESRTVGEITGKAQGRIGRYASAFVHDIRVTGTRKAMASWFMLSPRGAMNSSRRISPGCTGFSLFAIRFL